jgi:hypothetical protein
VCVCVHVVHTHVYACQLQKGCARFLGPRPLTGHPMPTPQQSKMEDHLDEAIHVLRSHAVGTAGDMHGLLPSHGALTTGFAGPMPLSGRHASLVSIVSRLGWVGWRVGTPSNLTCPCFFHRSGAPTQRTASWAPPTSCTTILPSPASPVPSLTFHGHLTPTVVSSRGRAARLCTLHPLITRGLKIICSIPGMGSWCGLLLLGKPSLWSSGLGLLDSISS